MHISYSFKKTKKNGTSITIVLACDQSIHEKKRAISLGNWRAQIEAQEQYRQKNFINQCC